MFIMIKSIMKKATIIHTTRGSTIVRTPRKDNGSDFIVLTGFVEYCDIYNRIQTAATRAHCHNLRYTAQMYFDILAFLKPIA